MSTENCVCIEGPLIEIDGYSLPLPIHFNEMNFDQQLESLKNLPESIHEIYMKMCKHEAKLQSAINFIIDELHLEKDCRMKSVGSSMDSNPIKMEININGHHLPSVKDFNRLSCQLRKRLLRSLPGNVRGRYLNLIWQQDIGSRLCAESRPLYQPFWA